jgi:DNA repair protein RadC
MADSKPYPLPAKCTVKNLPAQQQPREMVDQFGPAHVPDAVLLAIILRSGMQGLNVTELANQLLQEYGSLHALARAPKKELASWPGMGPVKAQMLLCALELARRMAAEKEPKKRKINTPQDALEVLNPLARTLEQEVFWVLLLDTRNQLQRSPVEVHRGTLNASLVHSREVFKEAIRSSCAAVLLAHNHPSGDPSPSREDIQLTRQLVDAGKILEIAVLDHIILGKADGNGNEYFSLQESGLVAF